MNVARHLVQGVDVWLNNPRRPQEASGTSGEKAVLNGGLNFSILDGWWAEAYDGANGFAIGNGETHADPGDPGRARRPSRCSRRWTTRSSRSTTTATPTACPAAGSPAQKRAMRTLAWRFNADRMVMDYVKKCYLPAAGGDTCRMPQV